MKKLNILQIAIISSVISASVGFGFCMNSIGAGLVSFGFMSMLLSPLVFGLFNDNCFK